MNLPAQLKAVSLEHGIRTMHPQTIAAVAGPWIVLVAIPVALAVVTEHSDRLLDQRRYMFSMALPLAPFLVAAIVPLIGSAGGIVFAAAVMVAAFLFTRLTVQRLRDAGRSRHLAWFFVVPLIGAIAMFSFAALDSIPRRGPCNPSR